MKKWLAALVACMMLLCSGCQVFFPTPAPPSPDTSDTSGVPPKYQAEYENKWCFQRLSDPLQACYAALYEAVMDNRFTDTRITVRQEDTAAGMNSTQKMFPGVRITLPQYLESEQDAKLLYQAFTWDNPQFFFLSNDYYYEGYHNNKTGKVVCRSLCLSFTMEATQRKQANDNLEAAVNEYLKDLPPSDDFAIELALHDRLLQRCQYHAKAGATHDFRSYANAFTAFGALVENQAVCEGYSRGMQLLLQRAGLDCSLVTGINEKNEPHMWNIVTVNGRNYHMDPTWDDADERIRYTFFNLTTESISRTHTIDADLIGVDTCTATQDNYYRRTNHYINTFERDAIAAVIARDMSAGETMIDLQFDPPTFINGQLLISNRDLLAGMIRQQQIDPDAVVWDAYDVRINETYYTIQLYKQ